MIVHVLIPDALIHISLSSSTSGYSVSACARGKSYSQGPYTSTEDGLSLESWSRICGGVLKQYTYKVLFVFMTDESTRLSPLHTSLDCMTGIASVSELDPILKERPSLVDTTESARLLPIRAAVDPTPLGPSRSH